MFIIKQLIFSYIFSRRLERKKRPAIYGFLLGMVVIVVGVLTDRATQIDPSTVNVSEEPMMRVISAIIYCSITIMLATAIIKSYCSITLFEALYASTLGYLAEHSQYALICIFEPFIPERFTGIAASTTGILFFIIYAFFIDFVFAQRISHRGHYFAQSFETVSFLVISGFIVMLLSAAANEYGFRQMHGIYAFIFCIFALTTQNERQLALSNSREQEIREQLLISQHAQYESYKENVELVNRKCHDLKHQVEAIKHLGTDEARNKALSEIEKSVLIYDSYIRTGCEMLDTILTQKNHICVDNNILFTCVIDGTLLGFMDPVDLYTLFGNMMDNAIEAVLKLPGEIRSISLSVSSQNGMIFIKEENPFKDMVKRNGRYLTTKKDRHNHGYGITSMEIVAEKYGGIINSSSENNLFSLSIGIPFQA